MPEKVGEQPEARICAVQCSGVNFVYSDGTRANRNIDLEVSAGEIFCLLGPNGAGKSTLIRQITAELTPSSGVIRVGGVDVQADALTARSKLGVVPQSAGLFEVLTVEQHLRSFAGLKGVPRAATRAELARIVGLLGLEPIQQRRIASLSGGQKRKLLIALALLGDPEVLVLDEPSVGLDPQSRRELWAVLKAQRRSGRTIILTTHYMDEAEFLADRIAFMVAGELLLTGTLADLYARLGSGVRATLLDESTGRTLQVQYFDSLAEAGDYVRIEKWANYAVSRVSLDDVYQRVVGTEISGGA